MYVGLRVVRGPKWDYDDEIDGGEGFVGTVVAVGSHSSSLPEKLVKVQWDCGTQHHHRAGFHGACDLYVFDSSPTGVNHENIGCGACNQNPILGIRWRCVSCRGLNLCTSCYMSDKHDKEHRFQRIDEPGSVSREVGTRHNSRKIEAKGIFPGAEVKRGPDWKYGDQDGGIGKRGSVQKLISWRDKPKNAVVVRWHETQTGKYRLGYKGKVDITCTIPYSGGWYYKEHLKKLGEPVEMKQKSPYQTTKSHIARKKEYTKGLEVGDEVRIDMSMEGIMSLQETSFGWAPDMANCIGKVGIVNNFEDNNGVAIWFDGSEEPWTFDVRAVSKVNTQHRKKGKDALHKDDIRDKSRVAVKNASASSASSAFEERFCPGVRVRVMADEELVKRLQVGHGVQDKLLCNTLGKVGVVTEVDMDGDIVVQFDYEEESLTFNPAVLIPIKERGRTDADEESGAALTSERTMPMYLDEGSRQAGESLISHASQGHLGVVQHLLGGLTDAKRALVVNYLAGGHTALHQACHSGHTAVVETLLRHGASLQLQDPQGYSALHHASYGDYSGSTAALLIKEGADIDDNRNSVMSTPLHLAVNQHNTQAALVLIQHGCDVNLGDLNGRTPLHGAVKLGNSQMVETILKTKPPPAAAVVDLHICDNEGLNPFHLAAQEKFAGAVKQMMSYSEDIVNVKENNGFTALHLSALRNDVDTAMILLEWGCCDVKATSHGGATAADLAASAGNELMLDLLANYDAEIRDYVKSMAGSTSSDLQTHSFQNGDQVVVKAEGEALKALQIGHGGWNFEMSLVSKKIGSVIEVMPTGDVCVFFEHLLKAFVFNPATLKPHISQEDDSTPALEHTVAERLPIPAEIIARGAKAKEAYRKVLKEGMVQVYRARIMLVGQDRAGKTSLKKSLLGMRFDPEQPSTDGIEVDPSRMEVEVDQVKNWQRLDERNRGLSAEYADDIAKDMVELLKKEEENSEPSPRDFAGLGIAHVPISRNKKDNEEDDEDEEDEDEEDEDKEDEDEDEEPPAETDRLPTDQVFNVGKAFPEVIQVAEQAATTEESKWLGIDTFGEDVRGPLIQYLKNLHVEKDTKAKETVMSIWDFAGQQLYYASHSVFLSPQAVYALVYDLSKDLNAKAEPCAKQGVHKIRLENPNDETNLDNLLSWLVSIHGSRLVDSEGRTEETKKYIRPPVLVVGTHADKTSTKEQEDAERCIQKSISDKPYGKHVVDGPLFRVDNTCSSDDEGVKRIKEKICEILKLEPYMGKYVPTKWFNFEKIIQVLIENGIRHRSVKELAEIAREVCFIDDVDEVNEMLEFYHSLGEIVKYEETVVLQTTWLIDLFRKVITVTPFNEQPNAKYRMEWKELEKSGILRMELVDHVFAEINTGDIQKHDLLDMMERFGLVAKFREVKETDTESVQYFVPSQLKSSPEGLKTVKPGKDDPCPIYLDFTDGFVPHGLFPQIVSRLIRWCSEQGFAHPPNLFQCGGRFFIGKPNSHELILIADKKFIKVVLRRKSTACSTLPRGGGTGCKVASEVLERLQKTLEDLAFEQKRHRVCFQWSVLCPLYLAKSDGESSDLEEKHSHLLHVEPNKELHCPEDYSNKRISATGLEFWFPGSLGSLAHTIQDGLPACAEIKRGEPTLRELAVLSTEICSCWDRLGYQLGLEAEIEDITANNVQFPSPQKKALQMLIVWHDKGASSTYVQLSKALTQSSKDRLAQKYCQQQADTALGPNCEPAMQVLHHLSKDATSS